MLKLTKQIFIDIIKLFRNFIHWNISKILITIFSYLIWIVFIIPFLVIAWIIWFFIPVEWWIIFSSILSNQEIPYQAVIWFLNNYFILFLFWLVIVLSVISLGIWVSYSKVLLFNLNLWYLKWEKINYFNNVTFNSKYILKYLQIILWNILFWLIPISIFLFSFITFSLIILFWSSPADQLAWWWNLFNIILLIIFILCVFIFIYISYRLIFSYILLIDKGYEKKAFYYIKKSFELTSWIKNLLNFFWLAILLTIILLPFQVISDSINTEVKDIKDYSNWNVRYETKRMELELKYWEYSEEELKKAYSSLYIIKIIFAFIGFIAITWILEMFITSYYFREIKHKKDIKKDDEEKNHHHKNHHKSDKDKEI